MPQKFGKHLQPLPGYSLSPETAKRVRDSIEQRRQSESDKRLKRKFLAEPEDLEILETLKKLPPEAAMAAAEGSLIARLYRKRKIK